jgi:hypothetical protein
MRRRFSTSWGGRGSIEKFHGTTNDFHKLFHAPVDITWLVFLLHFSVLGSVLGSVEFTDLEPWEITDIHIGDLFRLSNAFQVLYKSSRSFTRGLVDGSPLINSGRHHVCSVKRHCVDRVVG